MALGSWIIVLVLVALGWRRVRVYPPRPSGISVLSASEVAVLDAIADVLYPPGGGVAPSGEEAGVTRYLDRYLGAGQRRQRRLVVGLLLLLEHGTLLFPPWRAGGLGAWRRLSSQPVAAREAYLNGWEQSRWFARRLCFTSLRALCTMGYFGDAAVLRELGLAPRAIAPRVVEADLLYPRIGASRDSIALGEGDLSADRALPPLGPTGPLAPGFAAAAPRDPA